MQKFMLITQWIVCIIGWQSGIWSVMHIAVFSRTCIRKHGLTHWGRVTEIWVSKQTVIGSDNGLSSGRRQAIIWTNAGILIIGPFSEILIEIYIFLFKKIHLKMSSGNWQPFRRGLNVLTSITTRSNTETHKKRHFAYTLHCLMQSKLPLVPDRKKLFISYDIHLESAFIENLS